MKTNNFVIITDSSCDLPANIINDLDITVLPLNFLLGGKEYANWLDEREIPTQDIYTALRAGEISTTSAVNVGSMIDSIEPHLQNGDDVLCLMFSSGLSTTCNSAQIATEELAPKYPNQKIYVVDSLCASLGEGLFVYLAALERKKGKSIDEVRNFAEDIKLKINHWFTVDDLHFLQRGGRVSKSVAVIGSVLQIKPIMNVSNDGKLTSITKVRGRNTSLKALADKLFETITEPEKQTIFISHGDCYDDAFKLAEMIRAKVNVVDIIINYVGPVIGSHSGPGTIALFFLAEHR